MDKNLTTFEYFISRFTNLLRKSISAEKPLSYEVEINQILIRLEHCYRKMPIYHLKKELLEWEKSETLETAQRIKNLEVESSYFGFIRELHSFGKKGEEYQRLIPNYKWIEFYRDKAIEHSEEYTNSGETGLGHIFRTGKRAIPYITGISRTAEITHLKKLETGGEIIKKLKLQMDYHKFGCSGIGSEKDYSEEIYNALDNLGWENLKNPKKNPENKELIEWLFIVDFPNPITDVEEYTEKLLQNIGERYKIFPL